MYSFPNYFFLLQGNLEDAYSLYEQAIAIEKGKEHSQTLPMLYAQYSRFVYMVGLGNMILHVCVVLAYRYNALING